MSKDMSNIDIVQYEGGDYAKIMDNYNLHEITAAIASRAGKAAETIEEVKREVERLENNPDVVDIVATYADLQAYDTQGLTDKDVIRVLQDETHDGDSTYYRYDKQTDTWTYIGESKQYTDFVGTDGTTAGEAGLVPAPATTDADKYLKSDGTWDTVQAGPTVVQTMGTSTTDVMSQNATTSMVFADPSTKTRVQIGANATASIMDATAIGQGAKATGQGAIAIGRGTKGDGANAISLGVSGVASSVASIAVGDSPRAGREAVSIGREAGYDSSSPNSVTPLDSISLGSYSLATRQGEMNIGNRQGLGFNNSNYRLLTGVYDGQSAHDAATFGQVVSYSAINGAGAPTTATEGKYVGQLYYDTTNEDMYFLKAIDTTTDPVTYTWGELGGGPAVVQTTGTSTTDVMSQNATTGMVRTATGNNIKIGESSSTNSTGNVVIGDYAQNEGQDNVVIGGATSTSARIGNVGTRNVIIGSRAKSETSMGRSTYNAVAIGVSSYAKANGSIALGAGATAQSQGEMNIGSVGTTSGYNGSEYRLLTGLYDPQSAHDAATKGYVDPTTDSSAPTSSTAGRLGEIRIDTTDNSAYMCVVSDDVTPSYTWKKITA